MKLRHCKVFRQKTTKVSLRHVSNIASARQITVRDKRQKRPSLPDVKGTADDVMDEEEFK